MDTHKNKRDDYSNTSNKLLLLNIMEVISQMKHYVGKF